MLKNPFYRCAKCGNTITQEEVKTGCLHCKKEPAYKPSTFVKTFIYDYAEDLDKIVNHYAKEAKLEIKSISICHTDVFVASVVFERGFEI
jgi:DNA-directed RNA polymerase subunit RPC12/RpoP